MPLPPSSIEIPSICTASTFMSHLHSPCENTVHRPITSFALPSRAITSTELRPGTMSLSKKIKRHSSEFTKTLKNGPRGNNKSKKRAPYTLAHGIHAL